MILKPDSIKTIQPNCKILTFNNVDLKFPENDCKDSYGAKRLPFTISFEGLHVNGEIKWHRDEPYINFNLYDVDWFDSLDVIFKLQDVNFQTFDLTRKETCLGAVIRENKDGTTERTSICVISELPTSKELLRLKGKMTLNITLLNDFDYKNQIKQAEKSKLSLASYLCKDAIENLNSEKDFVIKCEDQEFHFNKTLLCLVSDVFRKMIQGKFGTEAQSGFVEIVDASPDTIKAFQQIVFENKDFKEDTPAIDLLMFADKYFMTPLKEKCIKHLALNLTSDNIDDVIKTAELIHDDFLLKVCTKFLSKDKLN